MSTKVSLKVRSDGLKSTMAWIAISGVDRITCGKRQHDLENDGRNDTYSDPCERPRTCWHHTKKIHTYCFTQVTHTTATAPYFRQILWKRRNLRTLCWFLWPKVFCDCHHALSMLTKRNVRAFRTIGIAGDMSYRKVVQHRSAAMDCLLLYPPLPALAYAKSTIQNFLRFSRFPRRRILPFPPFIRRL